MKYILSAWCIIFLPILSTNLLAQKDQKELIYDTIPISVFTIDGVKIGDNIKVLTDKWGTPFSYRIDRTAYDGSIIYISTYNRVASFILNDKENISDIDYVISSGVPIQIGDSVIHVGDDIARFETLFPESYYQYLNGSQRVFYLMGKNEDNSYNGFKFQFIIKKGLIVCFNTYFEE